MKKTTLKAASTKRKKNHLWKLSTDERYQIWPEESVERYLTKPTRFMPARFVNKGNISAPKPLAFDLSERFGIESAAFATHKKGFYISRCDSDAIGLFYVISGRYCVSAESLKFIIPKGFVFLLPRGVVCEDSAPYGDVRVLWFRMKCTPFWKRAFGSKLVCRRAANFARAVALAQMYADEIYSSSRSPIFLQDTLSLLCEVLRREFGDDTNRLRIAQTESYIAAAAENFSEWTTLKTACSKLKTTPRKLNAICEESFGATFSKIMTDARIRRAAELLRTGKTLSAAAKATGFSDSFSLSASFKRRLGISPKEMLKKT